jgi:hypothetical protein
MNQSQVFTQAHKITRQKAQASELSYKELFSESLKDLYKAVKEKKASIIREAVWQKNKAPHIFTKTIEEMTYKRLGAHYMVSSCACEIIKNIPHIKEAAKARELKAAKYYKENGGHVTMC